MKKGKKIALIILFILFIVICGYFVLEKFYTFKIVTISCKYENDQYNDIVFDEHIVDKITMDIVSSKQVFSHNYGSLHKKMYLCPSYDPGLNLTFYNREKETIYFADYLRNNQNPGFKFYEINMAVFEIVRSKINGNWQLKNKTLLKDQTDFFPNTPVAFIQDKNAILTKNAVLFDLNKKSDTFNWFGLLRSWFSNSKTYKISSGVYSIYPDHFTGSAYCDGSYYFSNINEIFRIKDNKKTIIYEGNYLLNFMEGFNYYNLPLSPSPDKKYMAFLGTDYNVENRSPSYSVYLYLHNIKNKKNEKYYQWKFDRDQSFGIAYPPIIKWSSLKREKLLAVYFCSDNYIYSEIIILDVKNNKVLDIIIKNKTKIKSLRWSPDDKKLGILALEPTKNTPEPASTNGILYIYDIDTKNLTKLMDCPDCFDFHFVE